MGGLSCFGALVLLSIIAYGVLTIRNQKRLRSVACECIDTVPGSLRVPAQHHKRDGTR